MFDCFIRYNEMDLESKETKTGELKFTTYRAYPNLIECYQALYAHIFKDPQLTSFDDFSNGAHINTFTNPHTNKGYHGFKSFTASELDTCDQDSAHKEIIHQSAVTTFMNKLLEAKVAQARNNTTLTDEIFSLCRKG